MSTEDTKGHLGPTQAQELTDLLLKAAAEIDFAAELRGDSPPRQYACLPKAMEAVFMRGQATAVNRAVHRRGWSFGSQGFTETEGGEVYVHEGMLGGRTFVAVTTKPVEAFECYQPASQG